MVAIADDIDAKIRVVKPSGVMQRLASFGYVDSLQSIAGLADNWPGAVAVGQDETVFMTTSGTPPSLVAAGAGGALRRLVSPFPADRQLAVAADGSLLAALGNASEYEWRKGHVVIPDPVVVRIAADGSQTIVAVGAHDAQSFDGDGENPVDINIGAADVSVATDGGAAHRRLAAHQQGRRECLGQVADSLVIERRRAGPPVDTRSGEITHKRKRVLPPRRLGLTTMEMLPKRSALGR